MIQTERLWIRQWQEADITPFAAMNGDSRVMEFFPSTLTFEQTKTFVEEMHRAIAQDGYGFFAVERCDTGQLIGSVGLARPRFDAHFTPCVEIGWRLGYEHWGEGFATEAALACLNFGFNRLNLKEIVSFTSRLNLRSMQVMQKIGMMCDYKEDFQHPKLPLDHPLSWHVLYRKKSTS